MWSFKEIDNLQFDILSILQLNSDYETWNENLHDLKLLTRWDYLQFNWMVGLSVKLEVPTIGPHTLQDHQYFVQDTYVIWIFTELKVILPVNSELATSHQKIMKAN